MKVEKFLYFLLGVLSTIVTALTGVLAHQAGVLPIPSASVSASPAATHAPTRAPKVLTSPTRHPKQSTHSPARTANPTHDIGAGKPGAFCATSRLGDYFIKNGTKYTCEGPKPYRWRKP